MIRKEIMNEAANFVEILFTARAPFYSIEQYKINVSKNCAERTTNVCVRKNREANEEFLRSSSISVIYQVRAGTLKVL